MTYYEYLEKWVEDYLAGKIDSKQTPLSEKRFIEMTEE